MPDREYYTCDPVFISGRQLPMLSGILIFLLILAFVGGGLLALRRDAKRPLPKNLPPPLKDEEEEEEEEEEDE
jgi:hypothetical protein